MRREAAIAAALFAAILGSGVFIAAYVTGGDRLFTGLGAAIAAAGLAAAGLGWAFWIVPHELVVDEIETYPSPPGERAAQNAVIVRDVKAVTRPKMLFALLGAAIASFAAAMVVPIRSLGTAPDSKLFHTRWRKGARLVRDDGTPIAVDDVNVDSALAVFPEGALDDAQSIATLVRVPESSSGAARGCIVYSRLCTHAGCPVALYRAQSRELICPCHQSVFNVLADGAVVSGPADHALPRLPIEIGEDGVLRAAGDFSEPVGPGFWERG